MRLHHLRALTTVADKGSFTGAAAVLEISQSSLSHAIADLERELGAPLFERDRRGARLTDLGRRVLVHARQALSSLESLRTEADGARGTLIGRVRIGSIPSAMLDLLPKAMAHFSRRHPGVELVLLEEPSQTTQRLIEWLADGTIDVALLEKPTDGLEATSLIHDELCVIVSAGSSLARHKHLSVGELAEEPFILSRYSTERLIQGAYARGGLAPIMRFEVQDLGTLVSMVREGLGISIVPRVAFPALQPGVSLIPLVPRIRRWLGYATNPLRHRSPASEAFIEALYEVSRARRAR